MMRAFSDTKTALAAATLLSHPHANAPTALTVDASDTALGGVLEQQQDGLWRPLAFFSRQLRPPERKYSAFDWSSWPCTWVSIISVISSKAGLSQSTLITSP
jgi:hypothetical protein